MNNLSKILLVIVIIETAALAWLFLKLQDKDTLITQLTQQVEKQSDEVIAKTKELEQLSQDLERVRFEREKLGLDNESLNEQITLLKKNIAELKKSKTLDSGKRKELEALIAKLKQEIIAKDREIAYLKSENDSLATSVNELTAEKIQLSDSLSANKSKAKEAENKLKYAAILKADNIKITVLKSNGKEIEDDEYKASKIDRLKISFTLADNKAAEKNVKDIYMRLKTPDGDVFSDPVNGGGYFDLADGTPVSYTMKQAIAFDNTNQKLDFITFSGLKFVSGFYKIELYCEGYKIGEGSFKVK